MGPWLETHINLYLNGPQIALWEGDCDRNAVSRSAPLPCLMIANMLAFEQLPARAVGVPIPLIMRRGDRHGGDGISLHYETRKDTLKTMRVLAQDFVIRDFLQFAVCSESPEYPNAPLSDIQVQEIEGTLPESITVTIEEIQLDERVDKGADGNRASSVSPWVIHSYTLYPGTPQVAPYCVAAEYRQ